MEEKLSVKAIGYALYTTYLLTNLLSIVSRGKYIFFFSSNYNN